MCSRVRCCEQQAVAREAIRFCDRALKSIPGGYTLRGSIRYNAGDPRDFSTLRASLTMLTPAARVCPRTTLEDYPGDRRFSTKLCASSLTMPTPALPSGIVRAKMGDLQGCDDFNRLCCFHS